MSNYVQLYCTEEPTQIHLGHLGTLLDGICWISWLCWTCCRLSWMSLNISTTSPCCWPAESWVECLGQSEAKPGVNTITNSEPKLAVSPRHLWRWVHLFSSPPLSWAPSCMAQPKLGSIRKQPEKICYTNSKIWTVADTSFMHLYNFCILLQHTKPRILTN